MKIILQNLINNLFLINDLIVIYFFGKISPNNKFLNLTKKIKKLFSKFQMIILITIHVHHPSILSNIFLHIILKYLYDIPSEIFEYFFKIKGIQIGKLKLFFRFINLN